MQKSHDNVNMTKNKKTSHQMRHIVKHVEPLELTCIFGGSINWCNLLEKLTRLNLKTKCKLTYQLAMPLLGLCSREMIMCLSKALNKIIYSSFILSRFKQTKKPISRRLDKYSLGYYSVIKRNRYNNIAMN